MASGGPEDIGSHDFMALLVGQMLSRQRQLSQVHMLHDQTALEPRIEAADRQIDAFV